MRAVHGGDSASRCLVVFLPGLGDSADDYLKNGFFDAAKEAGVTAQLVAVNATLGYYIRRSLVDRLRDDVLTPGRASGVTSIHLVGISMGGLGALLTAQKAGPIDSVLLLAPFLGDSDLLETIEKAGGLSKWTPADAPSAEPYQRELWTWLKSQTGGGGSTRVDLGFGDNDKLKRGHLLFAAALPRDRVYHAPGIHDWPPWKQL